MAQDEEQSLLLTKLEIVDLLAAEDCGGIHFSGDSAGVREEVKSVVAQPLDPAGARVLHGMMAKGATDAARI
jgi:hypothetical protein